MSTSLLFRPLRLGALELPNRIVMAPLARCRAVEERTPNRLMQTYYMQRASAGHKPRSAPFTRDMSARRE